jgi:hypothetical protein
MGVVWFACRGPPGRRGDAERALTLSRAERRRLSERLTASGPWLCGRWEGARLGSVRRIPTAPISAGSLIGAYAVAVGSGSRALGGVILVIVGSWCIWSWVTHHGRRTAAALSCVGVSVFVASHLLALAIGAWPSVLVSSLVLALVVWSRADAHMPAPRSPAG